MRLLLAFVLLLGLFLLAGIVTFPTDDLVRQGLAAATRTDGPVVVFRRAVLRPWGLRLDEVALRDPDGTALATAEWIRVRPSLSALLHLDRFGRPWVVHAGACQGTLDGTVDVQPAGISVDAAWHGIQLAGCAPLTRVDVTVQGESDGTAMVRLASGTPPIGNGTLALRHASITGGERLQLPGELESLTADDAALHWTLDAGTLALDGIQWRGREFEASGDGRVRLIGSLARSQLDLRLKLSAGPEPPDLIQRALGRLPLIPGDKDQARSLVVHGTIGDPQPVMQ